MTRLPTILSLWLKNEKAKHNHIGLIDDDFKSIVLDGNFDLGILALELYQAGIDSTKNEVIY